VAVKAPEASVVTVAGMVVCVAPLNFIVMAEKGAKPAPVAVTVAPTAPCIGLRAIDEVGMAVVTVNVAVAVFALASVAVTVRGPVGEEGTLKVAVKVPAAEVVTIAGMVVTFAPLNSIATFVRGAKLAPVTVSAVPTGPAIGLSVRMRVIPALSVQLAELKVPFPFVSENATFPVGVVRKGCDGVPSVSVKVAVHFVDPPTTWDGTQLTAVEVLRK